MIKLFHGHWYGGQFTITGPEDYVAAILTPRFRTELNAILAKYDVWIDEGQLFFDLRHTPRSLTDTSISKQRMDLVNLIQDLAIDPTCIPQRIRQNFETEREHIRGYPGPGLYSDPDLAQARGKNSMRSSIFMGMTPWPLRPSTP